MPKFQCLNPECKKTFHYAGKTSLATSDDVVGSGGAKAVRIVEVNVCPYCESKDFDETPEAVLQKERMLDMVECEVAQVKGFLDKGYVVLDRYAKTVRLALYKEAPK